MLNLYIADSIQEMTGGKFVASGLYPDRNLQINAPANTIDNGLPYGTPLLCVLISVSELPEGVYDATIRIVGPSGADVFPPYRQNSVPIQPEKSVFFNLQIAPFVVSEFGIFRVIVDIGEHTFEDQFLVQLAITPTPI